MALTATATKQTRSNNIIKILGMKDAHIITQSPHKPNILYWVAEKKGMQETYFQPPIDKLLLQRTKIWNGFSYFVEDMKNVLLFMSYLNLTWA